jgi:hypothetical protein
MEQLKKKEESDRKKFDPIFAEKIVIDQKGNVIEHLYKDGDKWVK